MKRAFYEWSAIGMSSLAVFCLVYWGVSKTTAAADASRMSFRGLFEASVSDGTVKLAGELHNPTMIGIIEQFIPASPPPNTTGQFRLSLPGFRLHLINHFTDRASWRIAFSLLAPTPILMLGAAISIVRCRKVQRTAASRAKPPAAEATAHPLD